MIYKLAGFKVKKDKVAQAIKAIEKFVKEVRKEKGTILYESFMEEEGSFTHFMVFKDKRAEDYHSKTLYVKEFVKVLYPLCSKKPVFNELKLVSSNRH